MGLCKKCCGITGRLPEKVEFICDRYSGAIDAKSMWEIDYLKPSLPLIISLPLIHHLPP